MTNIAELLKSSGESEVLEFKEARNSFDIEKLGKYFSALCNEANLVGKDRAYLLLGIKDDKSIVGTNILDKEINRFKLGISKVCRQAYHLLMLNDMILMGKKSCVL